MKKVLILLVLLCGGVYFAHRDGWITRGRVRLAGILEPLHRHEERPAPAPPRTAGSTSAIPATPTAADAALPAVGEATPISVAPDELALLPPDLNLLGLEAGAQVESVTTQYNDIEWSASRAIDGDPATAWSTKHSPEFPTDLVLSFYGREPALLQAIELIPARPQGDTAKTLEVEIWTSMDSPTEGFTKIGAATLQGERTFQPVPVTPTEARYVKLRIVSATAGPRYVYISEIKGIEGRRPGYTSLLVRRGDLARLLIPPDATADAVRPTAVAPGAEVVDCAPFAPRSQRVLGRESQNVLVVARNDYVYPPTQYKPTDTHGQVDYSIYGRLNFTVVEPWKVSVGMLQGKDTVALAQICKIKEYVSEGFKKALVNWVALGNKLIIHDSDDCGTGNLPDYSFLPYKFATSNPGAQGASSDVLIFVEENTIANARAEDPAFLDVDGWLRNRRGSFNELGDSNTIIQYDKQWCGHLFGTNVLRKNGFMEAYAKYGRGLIIYNGFDNDQSNGAAYRQLVTRELAQPFNPDALQCSARLGDFVITTDQRLKIQPMVPGRSYEYPLTLLSNQGYTGTIKLSLSAAPPDPTFTYRFEPETVELAEISHAKLTVATTRESSPSLHMLSVRGTDAPGRSNALCLQLDERKTGAIQIVSAKSTEKSPSKNLEIILDVSGSMKLGLGKKTRWTTALEVLKSVVDKLPDDFNVGLRAYAHRQPAKSKATCTDTELLLPIQKLNRSRILSAVNRLQPRGETPLIYSILQAPADLRPVGGGSIVVITDGEDTCKGDPIAAAEQLKGSGLEVTLNIVGFTLKGKKVQEQLTQLAQSTGGRYYGAQSGEALARALWIAAIDKIPYVILDSAGKQVARGDAGAAPEELEPGDYTVVVKVADQELSEKVVVSPASDTLLRVALKGDKFVVER